MLVEGVGLGASMSVAPGKGGRDGDRRCELGCVDERRSGQGRARCWPKLAVYKAYRTQWLKGS